MNTTGAISKYQGGVTPFKLMTEEEAKKEKEKQERRKTGKEVSAPQWFRKKDLRKEAKTEKEKSSQWFKKKEQIGDRSFSNKVIDEKEKSN